jgi:serine/threonine protein kinase
LSASLQDRIQSTLGNTYQVERELAPGGMSRLFLANERALDRRVVVKVLPPELVNESSAQRFQREMLVTARLQHAHILPVLTAGAGDGLLYYVTPFVAGDSLRQQITVEGRLSIDEVFQLLREVGEALAFAHALDVIHRDLKPDNIFIQHGHAILADFGIARAVEQASLDSSARRLTQTGMGIGTPGYMSPEQLAGDPGVDARTDIYALGIVAYEMLAGHAPFPGLTPAKLIVAHMTENAKPVTAFRADTPQELSDLVARCLEKNPDERWQNADDLLESLRAASISYSIPEEQRLATGARLTTVSLANASSNGGMLAAAIEAFDRNEWHEAFMSLSNAQAEAPLAPVDLERMAEAAWWIGKSDICIKTREQAYAQYVASGDFRRAASVALAIAEDYFHKLSQSVAHGWLQRAQRHLDSIPESIEHGWMARMRAMLALEGERNPDRAWAYAEQALEIARRLGDRDLQTLALQDRGRMLVNQGKVAEGMAAIDEAMAEAASGQIGPRTTGRMFCNMMSTCEKMADYRRAREWNETARQWCEPHAQSGYPGICRVHRAELLRLHGSWPEAEVEARRASTELDGFISDVAAEAYYELGEIRLLMGDMDAADSLFRQAHELGRDPVPGLALLRLEQGKADSAKALIERALSDPLMAPLDRAKLLPAQAEVSIGNGETEVARKAADELTSIAGTYRSQALAARAEFAQGLVDLSDGQPAPAATKFRRAWRLMKENDLPYEAARARVSLGQAYRACGNNEDAELELQAAAASFERLGAFAASRSTAALLQSST